MDNSLDKKILRKMGFPKDQKGILNRYLREQSNWNPHLEKTKKFILEHFKDSSYGSLAVFGSGWLLDLPMNELLMKFEVIHLFDIVHPNQVKHKYKDHPKIVFHETDLTGGLINWFYQFVKKYKKQTFVPSVIHEIEEFNLQLEEKFDCYISLNILNQLDILIVDYMLEHFSPKQFDSNYIHRTIQNAHINFLANKNACLIADIEDEYYDENKQLVGSKTTLFTDIPKGKIEKDWLWTFDTNYIYKEDFITKFRVKAVSF